METAPVITTAVSVVASANNNSVSVTPHGICLTTAYVVSASTLIAKRKVSAM